MKTEEPLPVKQVKNQSRRSFLRSAMRGGIGLMVFPGIIPARLLGNDAPGRKINVAQIGCGRMGRSDMGNTMTESLARVVAVCDLDSKRLAAGKKMAEDYYTASRRGGCKHQNHSTIIERFSRCRRLTRSSLPCRIIRTRWLRLRRQWRASTFTFRNLSPIILRRAIGLRKAVQAEKDYFAGRLAAAFRTSLAQFSRRERSCPQRADRPAENHQNRPWARQAKRPRPGADARPAKPGF